MCEHLGGEFHQLIHAAPWPTVSAPAPLRVRTPGAPIAANSYVAKPLNCIEALGPSALGGKPRIDQRIAEFIGQLAAAASRAYRSCLERRDSMPQDLIDALPHGLEASLRKVLADGERVEVQLKGVWKEALVCTDRRVMILKSGFMTGQTFGSNVFQIPYGNVGGVEVTFHILTGYFELSAGGMQNTAKSYWSKDKGTDPAKAPNCVTLNTRPQAARFRTACTVHPGDGRRGPPTAGRRPPGRRPGRDGRRGD